MRLVTFFKRTMRTGLVSFWRNGVVSLSSILIMTVTMLILSSLIFMNATLNFALAQIQEKVDINIYFYPSTQESEVLAFQKLLKQLPEVSDAVYVSADESQQRFVSRHDNDYLTLQALQELGENPFGGSLNVKANDPSNYETIIDFLESDNAMVKDSRGIIERINYQQNEEIIDRLNTWIELVQRGGFFVTLFFVLTTLIITYNTIRLVIYISREEIEIMRLVGAENHYIVGPFSIGGMLYGIISALMTMIILYPITLSIGGAGGVTAGGLNVYVYYLNNFWLILAILLVVGMTLGSISSQMAIRKYLRK